MRRVIDDEDDEDDKEQDGGGYGVDATVGPSIAANTSGHPLFPIPEGKAYKPADISWIVVSRQQNGRTETCPRTFLADELPNQEALFTLFGGGTYDLMARNGANTHMTRRSVLILPGPSKPLLPTQPEASPQAAPVATMAPPMMHGSDPMIAIMTLLFQSQMESSKMQMQMMTTLLGTVVTAMGSRGSDPGMSEFVKAQAQQNSELMRALVEKRQDGGALDAYREGQAAGIDMAGLAMNAGEQDDKTLEQLAPLVQAMMTPKSA